MLTKNRSFLLFVLTILGVTTGVVQAASETYPNREIELVVPYEVGSANDFQARIYAEILKEILNVPLIVNNRAGGGGSIGTVYVAKAKPDGYTIGNATNGPFVLNPIAQKDLPYKRTDFVLICQTATYPIGFFVREDAPWKNLGEMIDYAKKNPGKLRGAIGGITAIHSFLLESVRKAAGGFKSITIPGEAGEGKAATLLGGHVDFISDSFATEAALVTAGKLRALAVSEPVPGFPQVPTFAQAGIEGVGIVQPWSGVAAPKGLPQPAFDKLVNAFEKASKHPSVIKRLNDVIMVPAYLGPKAFEQKLETEDKYFTALAKEVGLVK